MKAFYEIGLMLTFFLLCISAMQGIVKSGLGDYSPADEIGRVDSMDYNISSTSFVKASTTKPDFSTAQGEDFSEKNQDIVYWVNQLAFGWQELFRDMLNPWGLGLIANALVGIFGVIQTLTVAYTFFLGITALRGGYSP